jgi:hypothetical protein
MRKIIRILVLLAIFAIPVLLGLTWLDHFRETNLPQPDRRLQIVIRSANHYMFSDDGAMLKSPLLMRVLGIVRLDGRRQVTVAAHYIVTFFDV